MVTISDTIVDVYHNKNIYENWGYQNDLKNARKQYLYENFPNNERQEIAAKKSEIVINSVNVLDNYSENAAQNIEMATDFMKTTAASATAVAVAPLTGFIGFLATKVANGQKINKKLLAPAMILSPFLMSCSAILIEPWATKKQIEASRLGRFKAKNEELNDIRNFVQYTPEQIEEAKNNLSVLETNLDNQKKNIDYFSSIKDIKNFKKDYGEYEKWLEQNKGIDEKFQNKLDKKYSDEDLLSANIDKELLFTITKNINNKAEDYSENIENAIETLAATSFLAVLPVSIGLNKLLNMVAKTSKRMNMLVSASVSIFVGATFLIGGNKVKKEAARVGRFKAKQELMKNPASVVYYSPDEMKKAEHIKIDKNDKSFLSKISDNLKFLKIYDQDLIDYKKYKNTTLKEQVAIQNNLKNIEITDEQLKDAKKLQENTFFVFDELDENSQAYSENIEAATSIFKSVSVFALYSSLNLLSFPLISMAVKRYPVNTIANKFANFALNDTSEIKQSINKLYELSQKDNTVRAAINDIFKKDKTNQSILTLSNNKNSQEAFSTLISKINEICQGLNNKKSFEDLIKNDLKQGKITDYLLNLAKDLKNLVNNKILSNPEKVLNSPFIKDEATKNMIEKHIKELKYTPVGKTLKLTLAGVFVPAVTVIVGVPFVFNSICTNIQKKAGKIGVMKALNSIDKTEYFT